MRYVAGPSVLQLTGHAVPIQPGESFEHDFSATGPEGEHGPAREAALLAAGSIVKTDEPSASAAKP